MFEQSSEAFIKDDNSEQTKIAYYILLACFLVLALLGVANLYLA